MLPAIYVFLFVHIGPDLFSFLLCSDLADEIEGFFLRVVFIMKSIDSQQDTTGPPGRCSELCFECVFCVRVQRLRFWYRCRLFGICALPLNLLHHYSNTLKPNTYCSMLYQYLACEMWHANTQSVWFVACELWSFLYSNLCTCQTTRIAREPGVISRKLSRQLSYRLRLQHCSRT